MYTADRARGGRFGMTTDNTSNGFVASNDVVAAAAANAVDDTAVLAVVVVVVAMVAPPTFNKVGNIAAPPRCSSCRPMRWCCNCKADDTAEVPINMMT